MNPRQTECVGNMWDKSKILGSLSLETLLGVSNFQLNPRI